MKKDLKQLIIEANKYSNADDFSNAIENVMAKKIDLVDYQIQAEYRN